MLANGHALPAAYQIEQGEATGRPCRLSLAVSPDGAIQVGGRVIELGRGTVTL
jgi:predicted PhzF superfamily epimerase YddE/YHI9